MAPEDQGTGAAPGRPRSAERGGGLAKLLGMTWWQGVGSIAAVVALAFTVWAIAKPSGNNATASAISTLSITPTWPAAPGCDGSTSVAVFDGGLNPLTVYASPDRDIRAVLARTGAAFGSGYLYLTFTVTGKAVAQIMEIRPLFYSVRMREPAWIYEPQGGCGATYGREFSLDLDRRTMADLGIQGPAAAKPPRSPAVPSSPLGSSFHVSAGDPAAIIIYARACEPSLYAWGLQVSYVVDGRTYMKVIGTQRNPLRSIGPLPRAVAAYTGAPPNYTRLAQAGLVRQAIGSAA